MQKKIEEPIHILNVGIRTDRHQQDDTYAKMFGEFCTDQVGVGVVHWFAVCLLPPCCVALCPDLHQFGTTFLPSVLHSSGQKRVGCVISLPHVHCH